MKKYLAFISYRHKKIDSETALTFRKGIEGYHLPRGSGLPARRRVFRDTDELPTSADLGAYIENALKDSEYLIALCSEDYVKSLWCMREIEFFLELGRKDKILPVLVSGTVETSVSDMIKDIPVVSDLTGSGAKAKDAVPELLSRMSGVDSESIAGAERRFRMSVAAAAVACVTAGLLGFAAYATRTAARIADNNVKIEEAFEKTEEARIQAVEERNTALLRQAEYVSEQAWKSLASGDTDTAIEMALSALPEDLEGDIPVSPEAEGVLRMALSMEVPPSYRYLSSVETDFDIRGYYEHYRYTDRIVLTGDTFGTADQYVDYAGETGLLETEFDDTRQKAIDLGYTKQCFVRNAGLNRTVFYGQGKPMYSEDFLLSRHRDYTLDGEPFLADGASALSEPYVLAWEEASGDRPGRTALFNVDQLEALMVLELAGHPVSAVCNNTYDRICIVDSSGTFSVFNYQGEMLVALEGTYTDVSYYYSSGPSAWVSSLDGSVYLIDLKTFREKGKIDCASPVLKTGTCSQRGFLLALCGSGVYVYDIGTGDLVAEIGSGAAAAETGTGAAAAEAGADAEPTETGTDAAPKFAVWKNDGNMILLIYDRRVDLYSLDTEVDEAVTDYLPLYSAGVPLGGVMVYSQDDRRILQKSHLDNAPGQDRLYCWDARTGELLWDNANSRTSRSSLLTLSNDGSSVWRLHKGDGALDLLRIEGVTGEVLSSMRWEGPYWYLEKHVESPDGRRGVIMTCYSTTTSDSRSEELLLFDAVTGEQIRLIELGKEAKESWEKYNAELEAAQTAEDTAAGLIRAEERTGLAKVLFSRDGRKLYCIQNAVRKSDGAKGICVDFLDAETGELKDEQFLEIGAQDITVWDEEEAAVLIDPLEDEYNKPGTDYSVYVNGEWIYPAYVAQGDHVRVEHTVRILDLREGKITAEVPFSYSRSPEAKNFVLTAVRPFAGGMALYWSAENAEGDGEEYCCRLEKNGSTGTILKAKSYEGRLLWVSAEEHLNFNGEEAYITWSGIRRMSDAALLLGCSFDPAKIVVAAGNAPLYTGKSVTEMGIAAAKDGSSVCVYGKSTNTKNTPFLILPSDIETLMEKGRKRLEGKK